MKVKKQPRLTWLRETVSAAKKAYNITRSGGTVHLMEAEDLAAMQKEDVGWRRLSDDRRQIPTWSQSRMQDVALHLSRNNHLAKRVLDIFEDFILGDGIQVTAKNENLKAAIDEFWEDPVNDMDALNGKRIKEVSTFGELLMPVQEDAAGHVRLGWLDPKLIDHVMPNNAGLPSKIVLTTKGKEVAGQPSLKIVTENDKGLIEGECFYLAINTTFGAYRGVSDIHTGADWMDSLEEIIFAGMDRARFMNSHNLDVTLKGADDKFIKAWLIENGGPVEPNTTLAHNENVEYKFINPQLGMYETSRMIKDMLDYTLGGMGIPSHWYGAGDSENLATAQQMSEPTRKMLKRRQRQFIYLTTSILRYAMYRRFVKRTLDVSEDEIFDFTVTIPDFSGPDIGSVGASISQLVSAIDAAVSGKYISHHTGMAMTSVVFSEIGADIDADEEQGKIDEEKTVSRANEDQRDMAAEEMRQAALAKAKAALTGKPVDG